MKKRYSSYIAILSALFVLWPLKLSQGEYRPTEARINFLKGPVNIQRVATEAWRPAFIKMSLYTGDKVRCQELAETEIILNDGSILKLRDNSLMEIELMERDKKDRAARTALKVYQGKLLGSIKKLAGKSSKFTVSTPTAVAGIRGTVFGVFVEGDSTELNVLKGEVGIQGDAGGEVLVKDKMMITVAKGDSAHNPVVMTAAKLAFMTMWAGAAIKIGSMGSAAATAWYATTPAIIGGAAAVVATSAVVIIASQNDETPAPEPGAKTIPAPPGWPNP
ncbi:MAG: FecR family protein [Candidatus Edwardsbacteria bacterium]|nr:FecR family protein [Candidatus Edwardsbacteria bacterium]